MIEIGDKAFDRHGPIICRARWKGYLMCSRPGKIPFVISEYKWRRLSRDVSISEVPEKPIALKALLKHLQRKAVKP